MAETTWRVVPKAATPDMGHAMAECDGWAREDRGHPTLQRWFDYYDLALSAAPKPAPGTLLVIREDGSAEVVEADVVEACKVSLMALCVLLKTFGSQMHVNLLKDMEFVIEANRAALSALGSKS